MRHSKRFKPLVLVNGPATVCALCGRPGADSIDHILPKSDRPDLMLSLSNMRPAHRSCNSSRGKSAIAMGECRR